ncbi:ferredoxin reductase [Nocardia sp. NPDC050378]|uniref:ferredoxin reductase n=1 Tax=Nocardia sp. NPDC050378 TaxID=3155400 RepID=UPI0033FCFC25
MDIHLPCDRTRRYSLCGDPHDRSVWRIAVLREDGGRGGSVHIHDHVHEGAEVAVRGPRNHFPLEPSPRYVFIAGGIGITPILPMIAAAQQAGAQWELHYGGRRSASMAFLDHLGLGDTGRADSPVTLYPQGEVGFIDLERILGTPREQTLVYCCGPEPLLAAVEDRCVRWPAGALHVERFAPKVATSPASDETFRVELAASGLTLTVPPDRSILEQAANDCMFLCVSRAAGPRLVLDL